MWYQKPLLGTQLNRAHPLARGLVGAWLFNEGSGTTVFDSAQHHNLSLNSAVSPQWNGGGVYKESKAHLGQIDNDAFFTAWHQGENTVTYFGSILTPSASYGRIIFSLSNAYFQFQIEGTQQIYLWLNGANGYATGVSAIYYNDPIAISVVKRGGGSSWSVDVYINGVLKGVSSRTASMSAINSDAFFCAGNVADANGIAGTTDCFYLHNKALSAAEVASLHAAPYQMFNRPSIWPLYSTSSSGTFEGTTLPAASIEGTGSYGTVEGINV